MIHLYLLVNPELEQLCWQEVEEQGSINSKASVSVVECVVELSALPSLCYSLQSVQRILIAVSRARAIESLSFEATSWNDFFPSSCSLKIEVEGIKGNDNRSAIAKRVAEHLFSILEKNNINATLNFKDPDFVLVVFHNGEEYFVGIDACSQELNAREYRVFPHQASFKGDFAYFFVRKSGFKPGENLFIGFAKDGTLAIEAVLYTSRVPVRSFARKKPAFKRLPLFEKVAEGHFTPIHSTSKIVAFDENSSNCIAARKNAKIAGVFSLLEINHCFVDDLLLKYGDLQFHRMILHLTTKDEDKLNDIYKSLIPLLKTKGTLLCITRKECDLFYPESLLLWEKGELHRGDSTYVYWLLQKNEI